MFLRGENFPHTEDISVTPAKAGVQSRTSLDSGFRRNDAFKGLPRAFWILLAGVGLLAVGYTDFALMAFHFKKQGLLPSAWIPVSYGAAMGLQGLASLGFGRMFDRLGAKTLILASVPALAFSAAGLSGWRGPALIGLALWTVGMGAQGSIMKALVAEHVPAARRGSAYGILNSAYGVLWFAGSAVMELVVRSFSFWDWCFQSWRRPSLPFLFSLWPSRVIPDGKINLWSFDVGML